METVKKLWPRIWAFVIDVVIVFLLSSMICNIKFLNPTYDEYSNTYDKYQEIYKKFQDGKLDVSDFYKQTDNLTYDLYRYGTSNYIIYLVVIIGYFVFFQKYSNGQTIGKRVNKIKVINNNGDNPSIKIYLLRVMFIFILGLGGIFSGITCAILPHLLSSSNLSTWISAVSITNMLLALIDCEVLIARKDRKALHDIVCNTMVVECENKTKTLD